MGKQLLVGVALFGVGCCVGLWWAWPSVEEPDRSAAWFPARQSPQAHPCSIAFGSVSSEAEVLGTETEDWLCTNLSTLPKTYDTLRCFADTAGVGVDIHYGETWISNYACGAQEWLTRRLSSPLRVEPGAGLTVEVHGGGRARYVRVMLVPSDTAQEDRHAP